MGWSNGRELAEHARVLNVKCCLPWPSGGFAGCRWFDLSHPHHFRFHHPHHFRFHHHPHFHFHHHPHFHFHHHPHRVFCHHYAHHYPWYRHSHRPDLFLRSQHPLMPHRQ